jgi:hypothetical protein
MKQKKTKTACKQKKHSNRKGFLGLDNKAQGEWNSIYLLIVFAIAALLMIALIKPMFKETQSIAKRQPIIGE